MTHCRRGIRHGKRSGVGGERKEIIEVLTERIKSTSRAKVKTKGFERRSGRKRNKHLSTNNSLFGRGLGQTEMKYYNSRGEERDAALWGKKMEAKERLKKSRRAF